LTRLPVARSIFSGSVPCSSVKSRDWSLSAE
jgi:hypothetical protein